MTHTCFWHGGVDQQGVALGSIVFMLQLDALRVSATAIATATLCAINYAGWVIATDARRSPTMMQCAAVRSRKPIIDGRRTI